MADADKKTAADVAIDLLERKAEELIKNQNQVPASAMA